jgi:hypothetical protein
MTAVHASGDRITADEFLAGPYRRAPNSFSAPGDQRTDWTTSPLRSSA